MLFVLYSAKNGCFETLQGQVKPMKIKLCIKDDFVVMLIISFVAAGS